MIKIHHNKNEHHQIKVIDGESFYTLATGSETALIDLYKVLPAIVCEVVGCSIEMDETYKILFEKAYSIKI